MILETHSIIELQCYEKGLASELVFYPSRKLRLEGIGQQRCELPIVLVGCQIFPRVFALHVLPSTSTGPAPAITLLVGLTQLTICSIKMNYSYS